MTVFTNFSNVLPDSIRTIGDAGQIGGGIISVEQAQLATGDQDAATAKPEDMRVYPSTSKGKGAEITFTLDSSGVASSISIANEGENFSVGDLIFIRNKSSGMSNDVHGLAFKVTEVSEGNTSAGFKSVQVTSQARTMKNRTNSGKLITRSAAYHTFSLNIGYNKLLKSEFMPIYSFLLEKQGSLKPFFVQLPQHQDGDILVTTGSGDVGDTTLDIDVTYDSEIFYSEPTISPGDLFTINDINNSNHTKAYMVTRVEDTTTYSGTAPGANEARIHFTPTLQTATTSGSAINFSNPAIKVVNKTDSLQYSLDQDNLYTFKLSLEEAVT